MTDQGKHVDDRSHLLRDLAVWIAGVAFFGALTFGLLAFFADPTTPIEAGSSSTSTSSSPTTSEPDGTTTTGGPGDTTTTSSTTTTVPLRGPDQVTVQVFNYIGGIRGAAGRLTQRLAQEGYRILPATDLRQENDQSRIWYRGDFAAEAAELLEFVPGGLVEALPDDSLSPGANVIIFLGPDFEE